MSKSEDERKNSNSTISDLEVIDIPGTEDDNGSDAGSVASSRKSSKTRDSHDTFPNLSEKLDNVFHQSESDGEPQDEDQRARLNNVKPDSLTDDVFNKVYSIEAGSKAKTLLVGFSIMLAVIPFASMYICYNYVFEDYDSSTDMLYSGIVAIIEVYLIVAFFVYIAYNDERHFEAQLKLYSRKNE